MGASGRDRALPVTHVAAAAKAPANRCAFNSHDPNVACTLARDVYAFSTCEKSSSTGVDRPKIVTDTRSLLFS